MGSSLEMPKSAKALLMSTLYLQYMFLWANKKKYKVLIKSTTEAVKSGEYCLCTFLNSTVSACCFGEQYLQTHEPVQETSTYSEPLEGCVP